MGTPSLRKTAYPKLYPPVPTLAPFGMCRSVHIETRKQLICLHYVNR